MRQAISTRYAQALADAVFAAGSGADPQKISAELHTFNEIVKQSPELRKVLLSPAIANGRKRGVVERLGASIPVSRFVRNLLFVLIDRRRADLLQEIAPAFDEAVDERLGLVRAEVTSATALSDTQRRDVENALSEVAHRRVRCEFRVDDTLIGGIVARIGSTVYDGSVRSQLEAMRQSLVS